MKMINTPGKFEGEPSFVPDFWEKALAGEYDEDEEIDGRPTFVFVEPFDLDMYPELHDCKRIELWEDDNGFVYSDTFHYKEPCSQWPECGHEDERDV